MESCLCHLLLTVVFYIQRVEGGAFNGDADERLKGKIFGSPDDEFTAQFSINTMREHSQELRAGRENLNKFTEGDIRITPLVQQLRLNDAKAKQTFLLSHVWPSNIIPYTFDKSVTDHKRKAIESALKDFETYTVMRFVPRTGEPDYINFIKQRQGCWSYLGHQGGKQNLSIGTWCGYRGTIIHELMHALGFPHEHTRLDRDNFINVLQNGIGSDLEDGFKKYDSNILTPEMQYDYFSIMQLDSRAFGTSAGYRSKTMAAKDDEVDDGDLGQRNGFSQMDIDKLKAVYGKYSGTPGTTTTTKPNPGINLFERLHQKLFKQKGNNPDLATDGVLPQPTPGTTTTKAPKPSAAENPDLSYYMEKLRQKLFKGLKG